MEEQLLGENYEVADCDSAIIKVGSSGKFQKIAFLLLTICYTCTGAFITNSFVFLEKDPEILCNIGNQWKKCLRSEACGLDKTLIKFNFIDTNGYSWTNDFKMECDSNYIIGLFGSVFFTGQMISSLFASSISDYIGRTKLINISMNTRIIFILTALIFSSEHMILLSMFFLGLLNPIHSTVPYILISELVSNKEKNLYQTNMFILESFSGIISTIFFLILQNWRYFFYFNLGYNLIYSIFNYYIVESPRYLYSKRLFDDAREVYKKIGRINMNKDIAIKFHKEKEHIETKNSTNTVYETIPISKLWSVKAIRKNIIIMPYLWFSTALVFFAINFQIKYMKVNIYLANFMLFLSEGASYFLSNQMMESTGKKTSIIIGYSICGISYFLFFILVNNDSSVILILILIFCSKFGASTLLNITSIYTNEVFPTDLRGRATSICSFVGKFAGIITPFLVEFSNYNLIISAIVSLISIIGVIPLEESESSKMNDDYRQLAE